MTHQYAARRHFRGTHQLPFRPAGARVNFFFAFALRSSPAEPKDHHPAPDIPGACPVVLFSHVRLAMGMERFVF